MNQLSPINLDNMSAEDIATLSVSQIAEMQDRIAAHEAAIKSQKAKVSEAIQIKFEDRVAELRALKPEGKVSVMVDGFSVEQGTTKTRVKPTNIDALIKSYGAETLGKLGVKAKFELGEKAIKGAPDGMRQELEEAFPATLKNDAIKLVRKDS